MKEINLTEEDRDELLKEVLSYIKRGNAGMDDSLYDITYATCNNDDDLRELFVDGRACRKLAWETILKNDTQYRHNNCDQGFRRQHCSHCRVSSLSTANVSLFDSMDSMLIFNAAIGRRITH